jgi:hypothetical protein
MNSIIVLYVFDVLFFFEKLNLNNINLILTKLITFMFKFGENFTVYLSKNENEPENYDLTCDEIDSLPYCSYNSNDSLKYKDYKKICHFINLQICIPIEHIIESLRNRYEIHENISDSVKKTYQLIFETPIKFEFNNYLTLFGEVRTDNIYFHMEFTEVQWRKWKKQTVEYDDFCHYFVYIEKDFLFSNGGYGSHIDIKAKFKTNSKGIEYAEIHEIQFYHVDDPDYTIKISDIRKDIFEYELSKLKNQITITKAI